MSEVKFTIEKEWKPHNVNVPALVAWIKEQDENCIGACSDVNLRIRFLEEPSQEVKDAIDQKWEDMDDEEHELCQSYESQAELDEAKALLKQSAKAKLIALGLTEAEADAFRS